MFFPRDMREDVGNFTRTISNVLFLFVARSVLMSASQRAFLTAQKPPTNATQAVLHAMDNEAFSSSNNARSKVIRSSSHALAANSGSHAPIMLGLT